MVYKNKGIKPKYHLIEGFSAQLSIKLTFLLRKIYLKIRSFTRLQRQTTANFANQASFGEQGELIIRQKSSDLSDDASSACSHCFISEK